jgi:hypothetical protein
VPCSIERTPLRAQRIAACAVVRVRHDIGATRCGFFDRGANLLVGELIHPDRIRRRQHAAGHEKLDVICALSELVADPLAHGVRTIDDGAQCARVPAAAQLNGFSGTHVAVASGLRQRLTRDQQTRAVDHAFCGGSHQPDVRAAGVAHRRETAAQRCFEMLAGAEGAMRRMHAIDRADVERGA